MSVVLLLGVLMSVAAAQLERSASFATLSQAAILTAMTYQATNTLIEQLLAQPWRNLLRQHVDRFRALQHAEYPGVYLLAYTDRDLDLQPIELHDIFYVGMSNSDGGVRERLKSFINGIEKYRSHSGGKRFYETYAHRQSFSVFAQTNGGKQFYVASVSIPCQVIKTQRSPDDLRRMGDVAQLEYYVLAYIKDKVGSEPELNKK